MPRISAPKTIGERLAWILEAREITASALSLAAGLSQAVVGQVIAGRYEPKGPSVLALAEAANVSPAWLMWGIGPREPFDLAQ